MKPINVNLADYQSMVEHFHSETDRAAAVLAGSFLEHYLAVALKAVLKHDDETEQMFGPFGPLSTFAQRISIAWAIGLIDEASRDEMRGIKDIRNHFAHHPLEANFEDTEIKASFRKLRLSRDAEFNASSDKPLANRKLIYLLSVGLNVVNLMRIVRVRSSPPYTV